MNFSQYNSHTLPLFIKDKLITFLDIITSNKLKLAFDFKSNTLPEDLCILFHLNSTLHSYTTHPVTKEGFFVPGIQSTSYGIKTLKYSVPVIWNSFALSNPELCHIKYSFQLKRFLKDHFMMLLEINIIITYANSICNYSYSYNIIKKQNILATLLRWVIYIPETWQQCFALIPSTHFNIVAIIIIITIIIINCYFLCFC